MDDDNVDDLYRLDVTAYLLILKKFASNVAALLCSGLRLCVHL